MRIKSTHPKIHSANIASGRTKIKETQNKGEWLGRVSLPRTSLNHVWKGARTGVVESLRDKIKVGVEGQREREFRLQTSVKQKHGETRT